MNWLITGGCGFIGTSLIQRLLSDDDENRIRVVDNLSVGSRQDLSQVCHFEEKCSHEVGAGIDDVELIVADILDDDAGKLAAKGIDVIVHLAANTGVGPSVEDPRSDCLINVVGTLNYLEAARENGVMKFIFASSGAPVGEVVPPIHEDITPHPVSPYGASKLAGEGYCSAFFHSFGIETVCLRFGNVYGPGSVHKNSVVAKFIRQTLAGETLEIYGDGSQTRDFIYIDDLTNAIVLSSSRDNVGGEVFQIASNAEVTISELVTKLVKILESRGISQVNVVNGDKRVGDVLRNYSDTSKAKKRLGWQSKVGLGDGLQTTVDYFLS